MPTVIYKLADGSERSVEVPIGTSVMQAAISNDVPGIVGECGGSAMCATCHVYSEERDDLPPVSEMENEMLDCTTSPRRENSRLSCQIIMSEDLDGLVVRIPETQV